MCVYKYKYNISHRYFVLHMFVNGCDLSPIKWENCRLICSLPLPCKDILVISHLIWIQNQTVICLEDEIVDEV